MSSTEPGESAAEHLLGKPIRSAARRRFDIGKRRDLRGAPAQLAAPRAPLPECRRSGTLLLEGVPFTAGRALPLPFWMIAPALAADPVFTLLRHGVARPEPSATARGGRATTRRGRRHRAPAAEIDVDVHLEAVADVRIESLGDPVHEQEGEVEIALRETLPQEQAEARTIAEGIERPDLS